MFRTKRGKGKKESQRKRMRLGKKWFTVCLQKYFVVFLRATSSRFEKERKRERARKRERQRKSDTRK